MSNENSTITECYVAFLDLMGVRNLVKEATKDAALCSNLVAALKETKDTSKFWRETRDIKSGKVSKWQLQVQAFSDSVVLFIPTESELLSWLLASVRRLHDKLLRLGIPLRGGITIGGMHWEIDWYSPTEVIIGDADKAISLPTPVAFGAGIVSAYDLENEAAVYPRILISDVLYSHVVLQSKTSNPFPLGTGKVLDFFRQDFDGLYHLDVLHADINRHDVIEVREKEQNSENLTELKRDESSYQEWLEKVRQFIVTGHESAKGEKLKAKYLWMGNYYNEKVLAAGEGNLLPWYKNTIPEGSIPITVRMR